MAEPETTTHVFFLLSQEICTEIDEVHRNVMQTSSKEIINHAIYRMESCIGRLRSIEDVIPESVSEQFHEYIYDSQVIYFKPFMYYSIHKLRHIHTPLFF